MAEEGTALDTSGDPRGQYDPVTGEQLSGGEEDPNGENGTELGGGQEPAGDAGDDHLVEVNIGGELRRVSPDVAAVIESQNREINEIRAQVQNAQAQGPAQTGGNDSRTQDEKDFETRFYEDPNAAMKEFEGRIREEVKQEVRQEYQQAQALRDFWSDFYTKNTDLKDKDDIVQMVMNRDWDELSKLNVDNAKEELAKRARNRIGNLAGQDRTKQSTKTHTESGSTSSQGASSQAQQKTERPSTLGETIRKRRSGKR